AEVRTTEKNIRGASETKICEPPPVCRRLFFWGGGGKAASKREKPPDGCPRRTKRPIFTTGPIVGARCRRKIDKHFGKTPNAGCKWGRKNARSCASARKFTVSKFSGRGRHNCAIPVWAWKGRTQLRTTSATGRG